MQIFDGQLRFGIHSGQQHATYDEYRHLWQMAEAWGLDWASVYDHFMPMPSPAGPEGPYLEGLTLLAAMAAQTTRVRCGILVTGVTYRHPAVLAKMAATIDQVSGGRLEFGIGGAWYELEHNQYGIPFPPPGQRLRMMGEAAAILKSMWTEPRTTFQGRYFSVTDALCEPKGVQQPIPLWIGGGGEKLTLRMVAQYADGWHSFGMPIDAYKRKLDILSEHCRAVGRDPGDIRKSIGVGAIIGATEAEVRELQGRLPQGGRQPTIVGTPEQCAEQLIPYVRLGVGDFLLGARGNQSQDAWRIMELFAKEVAPAVKAAAPRAA